MANLGLHLRFDEVFETYSERWHGNTVYFEGRLLADYARSTDMRVVRFINGGRRYKSYRLDRDGAGFKGWVEYHSYAPTLSSEDVKADKELIRKIRLVVDKGTPVVDVAYYFNVPYETVVNIKRRQGAFKGV